MPSADLSRVLAEHAAHIEGVVLRYADDPMDRDDLRQEIAIAIWRALPAFEGRSSERTWVVRIAHNRASTWCLRRARNRALFSALTGEHAMPGTTTGEHERITLAQLVRDAVERLPSAQREVLALAVAGHSPAEIAGATGRQPGAVRVALHRARAAVRAWLGVLEERP